MRCYRRLLKFSYKDHVTNKEVRRKIQATIGEYDELPGQKTSSKIGCPVSRSSGLAKTILLYRAKYMEREKEVDRIGDKTILKSEQNGPCHSTRAAENRTWWKWIAVKSYVVP